MSIDEQIDVLIKSSPEWITSTVRQAETIVPQYGIPAAPGSQFIARNTQYVSICAALNAQFCTSVPVRLMRPTRKSAPKGRKSWRQKRREAWYKNPSGVGVKAAQYAKYADDVEEVTEHPLIDLLHNPNPYMLGSEMEEQRFLFLELAGNAYDYIYGDSNEPQEIYPLSPAYVRIVPSETDFIAAYMYARDGTQPQRFEAASIGHIKHRAGSEPYYGIGPLHSVLIECDLVSAATNAEKARWNNGGRPDFAVESTVPLTSREQIDALRNEFERQHRGVQKTGKAAILSQAKIVPLGFSPKDMEYLNGQKVSNETIWNAFGVPQSLLQLNDANLASSLTGHTQYLRQTILPRVGRYADYLTNRYLPMYGVKPGELWFAPDNPVGEDEDAETTRQVSMVNCGAMTLNELRAEEGLEPYPPEIGDVPRFNGTEMVSAAAQAERDAANAEADRAHQLALATAKDQPPEPPDTTAQDVAEKVLKGAREIIEAVLAEPVAKIAPVDIDTILKSSDRYGHIHKATESPGSTPIPPEAEKLRSELEKRLRVWYADALEFALINADGSVSAESVAELERKLVTIAKDYLTPIYGVGNAQGAVQMQQVVGAVEKLAAEGVTRVLASEGGVSAFGMSFQVPQTYAMEFQSQYLPKFAEGITTELRQAVQQAIRSGLDNGEALEGITARIKASIPGISQYKAELIAQTEANHARSQGQLTILRAGGATYKQWLLSGNPCPQCLAIAAGNPYPIDAKFYDATHFDGLTPPAHPACACDMSYADAPGGAE